MKYDIILTDNEIEFILKLEYNNFKEAIEKLQNEFKDFNIKNSKKYQFILNNVLGVGGKIENNPKNLKCPNCNGKYVVNTCAGDLYYRLYRGTKLQKEQEKLKFARMGLYSNPWAIVDYYVRDYLCLNCGVRWNKENEGIYREISEIKEISMVIWKKENV